MKQVKVPVLILSIMLITSFTMAKSGWNYQATKKGVAIYTRNVKNSTLDEVKVVATLQAPMEVAGAVLADVDAYPQWMADCREARVLKKVDQIDNISYVVIPTPWPVKDRDVVLRSNTRADFTRDIVVSEFEAIESNLKPPVDTYVRIRQMRGRWVFEKMAPGKTRTTFITWADPGGAIPQWVVNMKKTENPYRTMLGMKRMVKVEKYINAAQNSAGIRELLKKSEK
jgi:ribosome-associated toxin RatA of RatAB toxin-antitoxin module